MHTDGLQKGLVMPLANRKLAAGLGGFHPMAASPNAALRIKH